MRRDRSISHLSRIPRLPRREACQSSFASPCCLARRQTEQACDKRQVATSLRFFVEEILREKAGADFLLRRLPSAETSFRRDFLPPSRAVCPPEVEAAAAGRKLSTRVSSSPLLLLLLWDGALQSCFRLRSPVRTRDRDPGLQALGGRGALAGLGRPDTNSLASPRGRRDPLWSSVPRRKDGRDPRRRQPRTPVCSWLYLAYRSCFSQGIGQYVPKTQPPRRPLPPSPVRLRAGTPASLQVGASPGLKLRAKRLQTTRSAHRTRSPCPHAVPGLC
uniref:uncharacterized protein LOC128931655 n=1 Tax=Callithrix jacchus TaxID=9483 RepID=UPI0023DD4423|nr:uncharacterized protein LOC128931655 [Callithrix jacchus]